MKVAASKAIASLVATADLRADYVIRDALDPRVCPPVTQAVREAPSRLELIRFRFFFYCYA